MKTKLQYIFVFVVVLLAWQYFGSTDSLVRLYVSSPSLILEYFSQNYQMLIEATLTTLLEASIGLLIATLFSFIAMIACFHRPKFLDFILPIMIASQIIPVIVLAPFFILLFGIGLSSKIAMAAVISFFPIFVNFVHGYKSISPNIHDLMKIHKAPINFRIKNVYFPLSMPNIMTGLKVSATLAVIGAIVAEFTGAHVGIGKNLFISAIRLDPDLMMSSLILATLIGLGMYSVVRLLEKKYVTWY